MPSLDINIPMYSITDNKYFIDTMSPIFSGNIHPMAKLNKNLITTKNNQTYYLLRYDKNTLIKDLIPTLGIFRSVILNKDKTVVCFSPPKSLQCEYFINMYPIINDCIIFEEFIEGTMINIFWDKFIGLTGAWEISTRNTVGSDNLVFTSGSDPILLREIFLEECSKCNLNLHNLDKNYCYSFVLQHPKDRIVAPIKFPVLYLVEAYKIVIGEGNSANVYPQSRDLIQSVLYSTKVKIPELYDKCASYSDTIDLYASMNTHYKIMGVVIKNTYTGEWCKIRNPSYEQVRQLNRNQPKLHYQYLCLRKEGKLRDYIKYYPKYKDNFSSFRDEIHLFTNTLYKNYVSCYIKKNSKLESFLFQYRHHMRKLHHIYISDCKQKRECVTLNVVINYVNNLDPHELMYYVNYNMHKRFVDFIQVDCV